jgi:CheY-like chemotaxis protein
MPDLPHILLVDDDSVVHKAVEFCLRGTAYVTTCLGAEQALLQIKRRQFDAALVDVALGEAISGMPTMIPLLRRCARIHSILSQKRSRTIRNSEKKFSEP